VRLALFLAHHDYACALQARLTYSNSIGNALVESLDEFIADRRIEPQIAIKMLEHFDKIVAEVLQDKVKARLQFKVSRLNSSERDMNANTLEGQTGHLPFLR
jgi:predicted ATPase with chaperone activity